MRKFLFFGVVLSMVLVSVQACFVSDEEFADELRMEGTEDPVATEELAATDELAGVEEFLAAEELDGVAESVAEDESMTVDGVEDDSVLACFEFEEPCYPDGSYRKHQCGVRCCDGHLAQKDLYCGECRPWAFGAACSGHGGPRRIRWSL